MEHARAWKEGGPPQKGQSLQNPSQRTAEDQADFRAACETGNPWGYLMTVRGLSKGGAREKLIYWITHYRGIAAEFGGRKLLMAAPRPVMKPGEAQDGPAEAQEGPAAAPEEKDEPEEAREEEGPEEAAGGREKGTLSNRLKARERCEAAVASGDPWKWLREHGATESAVWNAVIRWRQKYPDLMANVPEPRGARREKARVLYDECMAQPDPVAYYMERFGVTRSGATNFLRRHRPESMPEAKPEEPAEKPEEPETEPEEDDISLADFLAEYGAAAEPETEPETETEPEDPESPEALRLETWTAEEVNAVDGDPLGVMRHRAEWLAREKERMRGIIRQAEEKIAWIDERLEPLLRVIEKW